MSHSPISSDDETPEAFSFSISKKTAEGEARALQQFHADEKQKLKEKRRQKDRTLKERKAQAKSKSKVKETVLTKEHDESESKDEDGSLSRDDLEARMERAMREAQEESDEDGDGKDEDFEVGSMQSDEAEGSGEDDKNSELHSDSEDEALRAEPRSSQKNDYLPDHLFASAFSQLPSQDGSTAKAKVKKRAASPPTKKRKRVKKSTEVAVGSRVIRTLSSLAERPTPKGLAPPSKLNRFVDRSLNIRGSPGDAKLRGWERRPVNIGVMKRNGPAAHFVRDG